MPKTPLEDLLKKPVVVRANGFEYKGILLEVTATEITIRRQTGFMTIPMERVTSVKDPTQTLRSKGLPRFVDPSFYDTDKKKD